jgi:hypothetical protein
MELLEARFTAPFLKKELQKRALTKKISLNPKF